MLNFYERWSRFPLAVRVMCSGVIFMIALLTAYFLLARPQAQHLKQVQSERERMRGVLAELRESVTKKHSAMPLKGIQPVPAFSPLDFQARDIRLVRWQPEARGGALTLDMAWEQIPGLFSRLAQHSVGIRAFSVVPEQSRLRLAVQLEFSYAH